MISLALATALSLAAGPADTMSASRQAYSACLKAQMSSNLEKKAAAADFDKAITTSCAPQEDAFRKAVIAQQMSMKASRKDAEQAASDWVSDFQSNAKENYRSSIGDAAPST